MTAKASALRFSRTHFTTSGQRGPSRRRLRPPRHRAEMRPRERLRLACAETSHRRESFPELRRRLDGVAIRRQRRESAQNRIASMALMPTPLATGAERRGQRRVHRAPRVLASGGLNSCGGLAAARAPEALEPPTSSAERIVASGFRRRFASNAALEPDPFRGSASPARGGGCRLPPSGSATEMGAARRCRAGPGPWRRRRRPERV